MLVLIMFSVNVCVFFTFVHGFVSFCGYIKMHTMHQVEIKNDLRLKPGPLPPFIIIGSINREKKDIFRLQASVTSISPCICNTYIARPSLSKRNTTDFIVIH